MKIVEELSPIYRDVTKLNVNGNVDLPYLFAADDAEWYAEVTTTKNEGQEYKNLKLTGAYGVVSVKKSSVECRSPYTSSVEI